jgi:hypothetical protein
MQEHELWVTALFNRYLAGFANSILSLAGVQAVNPEKPWANFVTLQVVVALIVVVLFALMRPRLSMDRPGKLQHCFEIVYQFLRGQADEVVGHDGRKYIHLFGTIFFFILFCNLLGTIPSFESPTMFAPVPLDCAMFSFAYYNVMDGALDGSDRGAQPRGKASLSYRPTLCQHVRRRAGDRGLSEFDVRAGAVDFHGITCIRIFPSGFCIHTADDDLCGRRSGPRTLIFGLIPLPV